MFLRRYNMKIYFPTISPHVTKKCLIDHIYSKYSTSIFMLSYTFFFLSILSNETYLGEDIMPHRQYSCKHVPLCWRRGRHRKMARGNTSTPESDFSQCVLGHLRFRRRALFQDQKIWQWAVFQLTERCYKVLPRFLVMLTKEKRSAFYLLKKIIILF